MAGFLYFIPTQKPLLEVQDFIDAGLRHALADNGVSSVQGGGPGEEPGRLVRADRRSGEGQAKMRYDAVKQTWKKAPSGKYWVGFWNDDRPTPEDLARPQVYGSESVQADDGNQWIIPRIIAPVPGRQSSLPMKLALGEDGKSFITRSMPAYVPITEQARQYFAQWSRTGPASMDDIDLIRLAISALAINYRIDEFEALNVLGLISTEVAAQILLITIDAKAVLDAVQAQQAAEQSEQPAAEPLAVG